MTNQISFDVHTIPSGAASIVPVIDGITLIDLVTAYEAERGYTDPLGGYGGIIPDYMHYGPIDDYFAARGASLCRQPNGAQYVLGCHCGEVGCWPLTAAVSLISEGYEWSRFLNSCRPARDYSDFGPFVFERAGYDRALSDLVNLLGALP